MIKDRAMSLGLRSSKNSHYPSMASQLGKIDDEVLLKALPGYGAVVTSPMNRDTAGLSTG